MNLAKVNLMQATLKMLKDAKKEAEKLCKGLCCKKTLRIDLHWGYATWKPSDL